MDLKQLVSRLEEYASLDTAVEWDNVGLLVEPSGSLVVKRALVTNDLTAPVLEEALAKDVQLIISYHPVIWKGLKRLTQSEWNQRKIIKCIENRIAVFTPHSSWDSIETGSNHWLLQAFDINKIESVEGQEVKSKKDPCGFSKNVKINLSLGESKESFINRLRSFGETIRLVSEREVIGNQSIKQAEIEVVASSQGVVDFIETVKSIYPNNNYIMRTLRIYDMDKPLLKTVSHGRIGHLASPITIGEVVAKMKSHLNMKTFRLALGNGKTLDSKVERIAVGAGNGNLFIKDIKADVMLIIGEVTHHEILREVHCGVSIIVIDHSDTERCYNHVFRQRFRELLKSHNDPDVEIIVSEKDRDPLEYI